MPPKIPAQAIPAHLRPPGPPPPFQDVLPSGMTAAWRMPDPFVVVAFDGLIPDPITAATITLLKDEKQYTPENDPRKFRQDAGAIKGMYGLVAHMLETPRLDVSLEYGSGDTLGRREIGFMDVCHLYWLFRVGTRQATAEPASAGQPDGASDAAGDSGDVRPDASAADAD